MSVDPSAELSESSNLSALHPYRTHADYAPGPLPHLMETASILDQLQLFPLPVPPHVTPRPITAEEKARIDTLSELQFFLATAPTRWNQAESVPATNLTKFQLPNGEYVSCVLWNGLYHITGTDIVRALSFRFEAFGRPVKATKKWEEGVFSDLRNLKPGLDASLEEPKSPLLDFLFRNGCIRTQKKQKVFYWFSVPHDRLFLDALERDLKREKVQQAPTTETVGEPARSFRYDPRRSLFEQFAGQNPGLSSSILTPGLEYGASGSSSNTRPSPAIDGHPSGFGYPPPGPHSAIMADPAMGPSYAMSPMTNSAVTFQRTLFEGSPAYKKRRVRSRQGTSPSVVEENGARGGTPSRRSHSDLRGGTMSPRISHPALRKVSGGDDREASPLSGVKRERDESAAPDGGDFQQGEKVFVCAYEFCKRPFKRLEHLKRHVRTHTQERPFKCSKCARAFARQDNLTQHIRIHGHGRVDEISHNSGLGLGTPPPREGVDYYVTIAGANGQMPLDRWKTASPAGDGYAGGNGNRSQPFRASGSMPPPTLPYSSRSFIAPPDWGISGPNSSHSEAFATGSDSSFDPAHSAVRRYRSGTPTSAYGSVAIPPAPTGWAAPPHHAQVPHGMAPPNFSFSFWRPPTESPYYGHPGTQHAVGQVQDSPLVGYEMGAHTPMSYGDPNSAAPASTAAESFPTPATE